METENEKEIPHISHLPSINEDHERLGPPVKRLVITTKRRSVRNLIFICLVYFLFFTGFWSLSNLESTMNAKDGMGTDSQAVIYLCSMISCFFPQLMIEKFGCKTTCIVAVLLSCPYFAANFVLRWDTMMTSSVLYGLASGPLNSALTVYVDEMATRYHSLSVESRENVGAYFFGFYQFWTEFTQVLGNGISYAVLDKGSHFHNHSMHHVCGINFRPGHSNHSNDNLIPPTDHQRFMLSGIYLLLGILAAVVGLFLDPLGNDVQQIHGCYSVFQRFIGSVKHLRNPHQLLLLPLTIHLGMEGSFYSNDVAEAYIACSWGIHHVGFVSICYGMCGALMGILVGPLVKCFSQMSVILFSGLLSVTMYSLLFVWHPSPDFPFIYFVFSGVWGITDALWWSQMAALYGLMFPNNREAAYSNFFFWSSFGYFINYAYANYLILPVKIIILLAFLVTGVILYLIGQIRIKWLLRSGYYPIDESE